MARWSSWSFCFCVFAAAPVAQDPGTAPPPATTAALDATTAQALERLATVLAERRRELAAATARGDSAAAAALSDEVRQLRWQFAGLAARTNVQEFELPRTQQFDLKAEVEQLIRPLLRKLRDATSRPREIDDLATRIETMQQRRLTAEAAQRAVERTRDLLPAGSARTEAERELGERWRPTIQSLRDALLVDEATLKQLQEQQGSLLEVVAGEGRKFIRTSGASLLLAALVFVVTLFGLRWLVERVAPRAPERRGFAPRLAMLVLRVLAAVVAIAATILVLYARDDWFLLAVAIVFLVGAGWVVMRMLPQFVEQLRLVLNIGGVREGERLLVDGLPFRIHALRFYTRLENPALQGGVLRVPLQFLVGKRSRQSAPDEPWFPTAVGDVVLLNDGAFGAVRVQTPETVVVEQLGAPRSYPTAVFLERAPRNLSRGFVVDATFVAGRQRPFDLVAVQRGLRDELAAALASVVPAEWLRRVDVQFQGVTANGFELVATADCDGAAAGQYFALRRAMHGTFVVAGQRLGIELPPPLTPPIPAPMPAS